MLHMHWPAGVHDNAQLSAILGHAGLLCWPCVQADWKAAAERFIEKRGYVAAERLRAALRKSGSS